MLQNQYDRLLGGVETYFSLLQKKLLSEGHQVITIYTFSGKKNNLISNNHKVFYLPNLDLPEDVYYSKKRSQEIKQDRLFLKSIILEEKPDIIHINNTYYPIYFSPLQRYCPIIQTVHDFFHCCNTLLRMLPETNCDRPLGMGCFERGCISPKSIRELWRFKTKYTNREAMKKFNNLLVTTQYMKKMLVSNGFREEKVTVLPLFVEDWGLRAKYSGNVITYCGRLAKEKGVLHFIQMLRLIDADFTAVIIGDGPQKEECENLAQITGLTDKIKFTGFLNREELRDYFSQSAVVVIPSLWPEPFCLVGIEAMSFSKPVVAYDVGGIPSWLKDNYNGYLLHRGDINGLAQAVATILKNRGLSQGLGENARLLFEEKFRAQTHFESLFSIYESVLPRKGKAKRPKNENKKINATKFYPKIFSGESLPEYNKRLINFEIENNLSIVRSYPEEITISTTTRCNMDPPCVICERNLRTKDLEYDIDPTVIDKIKPIFKHADRVYLHCGGEPLMTKRSFDIIESVSPPTKIIFNTNGALFTEKTINFMVDCSVVDVISFSLDAATEKTYRRIRSAEFNKIIHNLGTLIKYRNKKNKDKPLLRPLVLLNFCILKQNLHEVADYVLLAYKLGIDGIDFSHMNSGFDWQQKREDYIFEYKKEHVTEIEDKERHDNQILKAYELSKECNIPINFNGNPFIGLMNESKLKIKSEISELIRWEKKCIAPWNRVVIENSGTVRMCYFHQSTFQTIGKFKTKHSSPYYLLGNSFEEIWNGKEAISVRKEFIEKGIAKRCITANPCIFQNRT